MANISIEYSPDQIFEFLVNKPESFWRKEGEKRSLALFQPASRRVPAYKDFLRKNRINPDKVRTWEDFQNVPVMNKDNYLRSYPLEKLCWQGTLNRKSVVFTSTSGSTGTPFYFPREKDLDWQYSIMLENFLKDGRIKNGPTLIILGFGLGVWIGGIITYKAFEIASQRERFPVSIITPGINKGEIFNALKNLAPHFKSTILAGYPPFIKDIIDEAETLGIDWKKINLRLVFAAESFNEKFREYLVKKTAIKNPFLDTMNIYGSADIGAMASETPLSILVRSQALKNKKIFKEVFPDVNKIPTLAQFNPLFINFEERDKEVFLTGNNTIPLIRYAIGDSGGVFGLSYVSDVFGKNGLSLNNQIKEQKIPNNSVSGLPFVYVYERKDFTVKLYGANIYPEHIREALQHPSISSRFTGKFTMITKHDRDKNQYLEVNCELGKKIKPALMLKNQTKNLIIKNLLSKNAEYHNNYQSIPKKVEPQIVLWSNEHPLHFKPGVKQKWVKNV